MNGMHGFPAHDHHGAAACRCGDCAFLGQACARCGAGDGRRLRWCCRWRSGCSCPADGSIGLEELHAIGRLRWGFEYHLGVDGLGALMLVLSAIVTLMSVDAAHRVHHQPGLYFALVLVLEAGLFGSFTALNFFHWFLFWELSLIPAFFLIKLWGGPKRGPAATQFFVYTMAGCVALLLQFPRGVSFDRHRWTLGSWRLWPRTERWPQQVTAHLGSVAGAT